MITFITKYLKFCKNDIFQRVVILLQAFLLFVEMNGLLIGDNVIAEFIFTVIGTIFYHIVLSLVLYKTGELK